MGKFNKLSNTEYEIMELFWNEQKELTGAEIRSEYFHNEKAIQTVNTFLNRLLIKGYLDIRKESRQYIYHAVCSKKEYHKKVLEASLQKNYGHSMASFVASYCGQEQPSKETLDKINLWLEELSSNE
ncbi:MAG: BlaI/MecI/CopY family transcriptional regulator [Firmicutes bacterium]|uniref:BlaI/MecI/CopY family transcriptional regulator n=1 Tax=Candidatus Scybalomonas excrementavium TaxID=2840943 RepID=A0A9D9N6W4_9FIRM|nr:BlaI/MecI/CopY family transcriptional regulator [Candidatus Scybalomonas excrementavium]